MILRWITSGVVGAFTGPLERAWQAKLAADTDQKRLDAEHAIKAIEGQRDLALAEMSDRWSATRLGRWLIVVPFGLWWAAIYLVQVVNPWLGTTLVVIDVPRHIHDMALVLVPAVIIGDAGALIGRRLTR
jgi:hypothetical protein